MWKWETEGEAKGVIVIVHNMLLWVICQDKAKLHV